MCIFGSHVLVSKSFYKTTKKFSIVQKFFLFQESFSRLGIIQKLRYLASALSLSKRFSSQYSVFSFLWGEAVFWRCCILRLCCNTNTDHQKLLTDYCFTTLPCIRRMTGFLFTALDFTQIIFLNSPSCEVLYLTFILPILPCRSGFLLHSGVVQPHEVVTLFSTSGAVPTFL